mgnify:CR=1 FL=1
MFRLLIKRSLVTYTTMNSQNITECFTNSNKLIKETPKSLEIKNNHNDEEDENEYEEMFVKTKFDNIEWGGPLRGGRMPEPTRFGDWERKGRCTDY